MSIAGQTLHGTHIAQTPFNGTKYLELDLTLQNDGIKTIESSLKDVSINPQKEMYEKYLPLEEKIQEWLDTPVGFLNKELMPSSHLEMALNGSELANFINQIQIAESGADISCTSFSNEIKGFNKNVTVRDIMLSLIHI